METKEPRKKITYTIFSTCLIIDKYIDNVMWNKKKDTFISLIVSVQNKEKIKNKKKENNTHNIVILNFCSIKEVKLYVLDFYHIPY